MLIRLMLGALQFQKASFPDMEDMFQKLSTGQKPTVLFFACSDSRIDPPLITESKPGDLFSSRNIGNIIPPYSAGEKSVAAIIEYALTKLPTEDVIVCGHSNCGAMAGLLTPGIEHQLAAVSSWIAHSHSVRETMEKEAKFTGDFATDVLELTKRNVLAQVENLKTYPLVAEKLERKELNLHAWYFDIKTATVSVYSEKYKHFIPLEKAFLIALEERRKRIVCEVAMNYLAQFTNPLTAKDYQYVTRVFSLLGTDLSPIWPQIKAQISSELWKELGALYRDPLDPQFTNIVEQGCKTRLENLKDFQKNIIESIGYHQYCSKFIHRNLLFKPAPLTLPTTITVPSTIYNELLSNGLK
ncbi:carbonic anhydrase [Legionella nautarum]|uniref:carbonic anhydrase n=1 Tax=Legionella nautarum TaxID=45070 RepID=A0A0W0X2T2_9GAMM|nr:carbonic anhydrase [Legionella nautarum]KTD38865.1 carbonic anhydrase [Legionella nautarum]